MRPAIRAQSPSVAGRFGNPSLTLMRQIEPVTFSRGSQCACNSESRHRTQHGGGFLLSLVVSRRDQPQLLCS